MDRFITQENTRSLQPVVKPVSIGGLNADSVETASQTLNSVEISEVGQPMSCVPLGTNSVVPEEFIATELVKAGDCVTGNFSLYTHEIGHFFITNYDCQRPYVLTAPDATIELVTHTHSVDALEPGTLIYTAPTSLGSVSGSLHFTVNNQVYPITVLASYIEKPVITYPGNEVQISTVPFTALASPFTCVGYQDELKSSDWEIATDINFTNIVWSEHKNGYESGPIDELVVSSLSDGVYYIRIKYSGRVLPDSQWSDIRTFTRVTLLPHTEVALKYPNEYTTTNYMGYSSAIDATGNRIVAGAYGTTVGGVNNSGAAYVFVKSGQTWVQEAVLSASDKLANDALGWDVAINAAGDRIVVSSYEAGSNNFGAAYVFTRVGTSWSQEAKLLPNNPITWSYFGQSVDIDDVGNRIIVGASRANIAGHVQQYIGAVYIFKRTGTSWAQEAELIDTSLINDGNFGNDVAISGDGTRAVIGAYCLNSAQQASAGSVSIFLRSGSTWASEARLTANDGVINDKFGNAVSINQNGSVIIVGAYNHDLGVASSNKGAAYVFTRAGITWSQEAKLIASDIGYNDWFGQAVDISADGTVIVVSSIECFGGGFDYPGAAYIYQKVNSNWIEQYKIIPSIREQMGWFGSSVGLSADKSTCVVGSYFKDYITNYYNDVGAVYIFK